MDEIDNQKRQNSPWIWITGFIILAAFAWIILNYVYTPRDQKRTVAGEYKAYTKNIYKSSDDSINEVREFMYYLKDTANLLPAIKYTEKGLIKLQSALSYVADRTDSTNNSVTISIDSLDKTVVKIDTSSSNYLSQVKPAFSAAVNVMETIQKLNYPDLKANIVTLRNTENTIDEKKSVRSQIKKIRCFYIEAGDIIKGMKLTYMYTLNKASY